MRARGALGGEPCGDRIATVCVIPVPVAPAACAQVGALGAEGYEGDLDIQYIGAIGVGNTNYFYTIQEWMYEFALAFVTTPASTRPAVFSISYAWAEVDQVRRG